VEKKLNKLHRSNQKKPEKEKTSTNIHLPEDTPVQENKITDKILENAEQTTPEKNWMKYK